MRRFFLLVLGALATTGCHAQLDAQCASQPYVADSVVVTNVPADPQDVPEYVDVPAAPPGEAVPSVDVFYTELSPYGGWYDDAEYGRVFTPARVDYVPYTDGRWEYTEQGWTWASNEPIGWAVCHYGRWVHKARWIWVPDVTWGPAWVEWRTTDSYVGWAPLPAPGLVATAYGTPEIAWHFVEPRMILEVDLRARFLSPDRVPAVLHAARPIKRYARTTSGALWTAGPSPERLRTQYQVSVPVTASREHEIGRMTGNERQEAERHAEDRRRAEVERWRVEAQQRAAAEQARKAAEQQRKAAQQARAAEQARVDQARAAEQQRVASEQARAMDVQRQAAAQQRVIDAPRRAVEPQPQPQAMDPQRSLEARERAAEQARVVEAQRRIADQQRIAAQQQAMQQQAMQQQAAIQRAAQPRPIQVAPRIELRVPQAPAPVERAMRPISIQPRHR